MLEIPFIPQPDSQSCALACYTMVAKYFFPEVTLEQIAKISEWNPGYVVWSYKFWKYIMDRGIKITEYDLIDAKTWADTGIEGLKKSVSEKEFNYYVENTKDINSYSDDIKKVLAHTNFTFHRKKPSFENLEQAVRGGCVCEVVLDSRTLRGKEGFSLHRVVVLGMIDGEVIFNDPAVGPSVRSEIELFKKA